FQLNVSFNKAVEMNMTESSSNSKPDLPTNMKGTGKFISIDVNDSAVTIEATLAYQIMKTDLPSSVDPFKLQFAYYKDSANAWQVATSWVEEIDANTYMVYANTTHFSTWTIVEQETTETTSNVNGFVMISLLLPVTLLVVKKRRK
ncbi:MAG: hypothetical protein ACFFD1_09175, partial [Candidatus Thorarchaeota archaeon]